MSDTDRETRLVDAFATFADTLVTDYDVLDLLQTLVDTCRSLLDVTAVGLLLADPESGELDVVASTSEATRIVEAMQLSAVAGPCIDAFHEGRVVSAVDLRSSADRWPAFRRSALAQGFNSVYAIPMRLRETTIGALNLFRDEPEALNPRDARVAQALADLATMGILNERTLRASDLLQRQLQHALDSRVLIEQAKGVLAHMHGIDMDEAFLRLRAFARANRRSIAEVAKGLVDRTLVF